MSEAISNSYKDVKDLDTLNHRASHIMASAIQELFPDVKFAIGPAIEKGFYYDFDTGKTVTPDDLKSIEDRMKKLIKKDLKFAGIP